MRYRCCHRVSFVTYPGTRCRPSPRPEPHFWKISLCGLACHRQQTRRARLPVHKCPMHCGWRHTRSCPDNNCIDAKHACICPRECHSRTATAHRRPDCGSGLVPSQCYAARSRTRPCHVCCVLLFGALPSFWVCSTRSKHLMRLAAVLSKVVDRRRSVLTRPLHCLCCQPYHHVADGLNLLLGILLSN